VKIKNQIEGEVLYFNEVDSTNKVALTIDAPDKSVIIAKTQTSGRGRLGRIWNSGGDGIYITILLKPKEFNEHFSCLTLLTGIAVARVIEDSLIKWPNDIVVNGKKVSGILVEGTFNGGDLTRIAVGIGINVNDKSFSNELKDKATSLFIIKGKKQNKEEIIGKVLKEFFGLYEVFLKDGFPAIKKEYVEKSATLGREVLIIKDNEKKLGNVIDITENGELIAKIDDKIEILNSGEVSVRGLLGYN